jgi:hypothetical protein
MRLAPFCLPFLLFLLLAGCAGLDQEACRSADWYDVGHRDGLFGMQRQDGIYAGQCERHGVKIDVARYGEGWTEGDFQGDLRRSGSHD